MYLNKQMPYQFHLYASLFYEVKCYTIYMLTYLSVLFELYIYFILWLKNDYDFMQLVGSMNPLNQTHIKYCNWLYFADIDKSLYSLFVFIHMVYYI